MSENAELFDAEFRRQLSAFRLEVRHRGTHETHDGQRGLRGEGRSEFREHRAYVEGDDLRRVDWNLLGRLDELCVKVFEPESRVGIEVVVDQSLSMAAPHARRNHFAKRAAAALSFGLANESRPVRVLAAHEKVQEVATSLRTEADLRDFLPRWASQTLAGTLECSALGSVLNQGTQARCVFILSDFADSAEQLLALSLPSRWRVVVLRISVAEDREAPFGDHLLLHDPESGEELRVAMDDQRRQRYAELRVQEREDLQRRAIQRGFDFVEVDADQDPFLVLRSILGMRGGSS